MSIEKKEFVPYRFEEERDQDKSKVFPIRLNLQEQANLTEAMNLLQQEKHGTALKQLATLGMYVLHDRSMAHVLQVLQGNIRKNKRLGIEKVEVK